MAQGAYSIKNTPFWGGQGASSSPQTAYSKGYEVFVYGNRSGRRGTYAQANGSLNNNEFQWPIFVTDLNIDFSVQGSMAQSRTTRDFYPHNFVQPAFTVQGQSIDQLDYGTMCDFVHMCQKKMVNKFVDTGLIQLQIAHRGVPGQRTNGIGVTVNGHKLYNQTIRGPHQEILALGVITSMPREHNTGVIAPTWSFEFQVFRMIQGPYAEGPTQSASRNMKTWVDLLKSGKTLSSDDNSLRDENRKVLAWVAQNSSNVISSTAGDGTFNPGSAGTSSGVSGGNGPLAGPGGGGAVTSNVLNANQKTFATYVSENTGLNANVVGAWVHAEEPASASSAPNGANNWLNIGAFDSGNWSQLGGNWDTPEGGGKLTVEFLRGSFGGASAGIRAILNSVGLGPQAQISAIQQSGWATSGYPDLPSDYQTVVSG